MLANNDEYNRRISICKQCPYIQGTKIQTCSLCGCILSMKARLEEFDCPIGKWSGNGQILSQFVPIQAIGGGCNSCGKK